MALYLIDVGHNAPSGDTGAFGIKSEDKLVIELGELLSTLLMEKGHQVLFCNPSKSKSVNESLNARCQVANRYPHANLFISLHFNAFKDPRANGTEVWVYNQTSKAYTPAKRVVSKLNEIGFTNRGVKCGNFYVLKNTQIPAMLVETAFVTSRKDMDLYDPERAAIAIAEGILNQEIEPVDHKAVYPENVTLRIKIDTVLKRTTEMAAELEATQKANVTNGDYEVNLLGEEEGHYLVRFLNSTDFTGDWFVFSGFCEIKKNTPTY